MLLYFKYEYNFADASWIESSLSKLNSNCKYGKNIGIVKQNNIYSIHKTHLEVRKVRINHGGYWSERWETDIWEDFTKKKI